MEFRNLSLLSYPYLPKKDVSLINIVSTFKMLDNRNSGSVDNNFSQDNAISDSSNFDSEIDDDIPF